MAFIVPDVTHLRPDDAPEPIWEAVGHALSHWEVAEINMAVLYCGFKGIRPSIAALTAYGNEGTVFSTRLCRLEGASEAYFTRNCDQRSEGKFKLIVEEAKELSIYRHRIAHGIVTRRHEHGWWWLAPPWYTEKLNVKGEPYFYCSGQVRAIAEQFSKFAGRVKQLRTLLLPQLGCAPQSIPPSTSQG